MIRNSSSIDKANQEFFVGIKKQTAIFFFLNSSFEGYCRFVVGSNNFLLPYVRKKKMKSVISYLLIYAKIKCKSFFFNKSLINNFLI